MQRFPRKVLENFRLQIPQHMQTIQAPKNTLSDNTENSPSQGQISTAAAPAVTKIPRLSRVGQ